MEVPKKLKALIKEKKKELKQRDNLTHIFTLRCEVCGSTKTKYDGKDFEQWDKDLFSKQHKHKIRRFIMKVVKKT